MWYGLSFSSSFFFFFFFSFFFFGQSSFALYSPKVVARYIVNEIVVIHFTIEFYTCSLVDLCIADQMSSLWCCKKGSWKSTALTLRRRKRTNWSTWRSS